MRHVLKFEWETLSGDTDHIETFSGEALQLLLAFTIEVCNVRGRSLVSLTPNFLRVKTHFYKQLPAHAGIPE